MEQAMHYHRPSSVAEAVKLAGTHSDDHMLAGGQTLLPAVRLGLLAPTGWIDLAGIAELRGIRVDGDDIVIGSMTTHEAVSASPDVRKRIPALAQLAAGIGDKQVRNRGTIGGSLANSDPAACYPAGVLALGATVQTDRRTIAADEFFKGLFETALAPGRNHYCRAFSGAGEGGLYQVQATGFALCAGRSVRCQDCERRARRSDRRGAVRIPRQGARRQTQREVRG